MEWGGYHKEREGVVGGRTEWEREGRERGTEEGMEGETKGGYYKGRERGMGIGGREVGSEGWRVDRRK